MKISSENNLMFFVIFLIFICLHLFLMFSLQIYPFVDLPNHLAASTIYKYHADSTNQFFKYYTLSSLFNPNNFHLIFCSLRIFPTVEFGNKIFYCIYVILLPLSVFLIIKQVRGNVWFALLSFLVLYNYNVIWGFVGYTISIPFVILLFYFILKLLEMATLKNKLIVLILFILLFFIHIQSLLFSLLLFFSLCFYHYKTRFIVFFRHLFLIIPASALIAFWWFSDGCQEKFSLFQFLFNYYKNEYLLTIARRIKILYFDNSHLFDGFWGILISLLFAFFIIVPFLIYLIKNRKSIFVFLRNKKMANIWIFFLVSLFCCLLLPNRIPEQRFLYERFSVFLLISIIILTSVLIDKKISHIRIISFCLICLMHFILYVDYFVLFQKENQDFIDDHFLINVIKEKKLSGLIYDYKFRGSSTYIHFPSYFIVWGKGIATTSLINYRFGLIRRKADIRELPVYNEWVGLYKNYDDEYDQMDYILIRGTIPESDIKYFDNFTLVKSLQKWSLYERITKI